MVFTLDIYSGATYIRTFITVALNVSIYHRDILRGIFVKALELGIYDRDAYVGHSL